MSSKNIISAINMFCIPVVSYAAPCLEWTEEELRNLDVTTRKKLNEKHMLHKNSCISRLYVSRKLGGRGLLNVQEQVHKIIRNTKENIAQRTNNGSILSVIKLEKIHTAPTTEFLALHIEKPLHGQLLKNNDADKDSFNWLRHQNIRKDIESYIFALQEQSIPTKYYLNKIEKRKIDPRCRVCNQAPETIHHLLNNCSTLAKKQYLTRHNEMGKHIYNAFCKKHNLPHNKTTNIPNIVENQEYKLLWDFPIQTYKAVEHNRPDMIFINKMTKKATVIDFSNPFDSNIRQKYDEKVSKYLALSAEIRNVWQLKSVKIQPIVIGSLGALTTRMKNDFKSMNSSFGLSINVSTLQKTVLEQSVKIVKSVINS